MQGGGRNRKKARDAAPSGVKLELYNLAEDPMEAKNLVDQHADRAESMLAAMEMCKVGNTTRDIAEKFPVYDDDKYGTVTLQQFAHSIGLSLYEGMWTSRAYSLDYPAEIKENMVFAVETYAGHPALPMTCRLEDDLVVTTNGPVRLSLFPWEAYFLD